MENIFFCTEYAWRKFIENEKHVTRLFHQHVLIFMTSGALRFVENGQPIELTAGEYYIQKKGLFQEGREASDMPEYFFIHFDGDWDTLIQSIDIRGHFNIKDFIHLFQELDTPTVSVFKQQALFLQSLDKLATPLLSQNQIANQLKTYVDLNYLTNFNMEQLSTEFSYSAHYLEKRFKEHFHITIHQYLNQKRIEEAKLLMLTTDRSIETIAFACGYKEFSTFYRNFLALENTAPQKWRKEKLLNKI